VALDKNSLQQIDVPAKNQPCETFGIHPNMKALKKAYDAGNATFLANMGALVEPVTKENMGTKQLPPSLYAHNVMTRHAQSLHPQLGSADGVIGRMVNALNSQSSPYKSSLYSVSGNKKILEGGQAPDILDKSKGVVKFLQHAQMAGHIKEILTEHRAESVFADTYATLLESAFNRSEVLGTLLDGVTLSQPWTQSTSISKQFKQVARVLRAKQDLPPNEKPERAAFVVTQGSYDTHNDAHETLTSHLTELDDALQSFHDEMNDAGIWDDVAVVALSDFGRTLTSNGLGTDHAWGGNYFIMGGAVNGEKILGDFPDLSPESEVNIGRGRILPTRSWESLWHGVAEWFGVGSANMATVLPNMDNFKPPKHGKNLLFSKSELFKN